jgi:CheY-like chemotaxis protein
MIARRIRLLQQSSIDEESKDDMSQMAEGQSSTVQVIDKEFKCLLANDCDLQLMIMTHILDDCGVEIVTAINGQDALEKVMESEKKFDFIILDLNMPIMDGYDAAMKIISYYKGNDNIF